jgi:hypothetical protein
VSAGHPDLPGNWPRVILQCDTEAALHLLTDYYATRRDGAPRYTGARFEAVAALNPDPYTIGPADFVAVSLLGVNVPKEAVIRLLDKDTAAEITRLLHAIPTDTDIVDAESDELTRKSPAGQLWELLRFGRDGVGRTTTSKLIAAKRPQLIPIWDSFVEQATGVDTDDYWRKFRKVLLDDDRKIWNWLGHIKSQVPGLAAGISTLRILDVVLWMLVDSGTLEPQRQSSSEPLSRHHPQAWVAGANCH